jgi:hypothetical protein
MLKKISLFVSVALPLSISQSFAALEWVTFEDKDTENGRQVRAVLKDSETSAQVILESTAQESYNSYVETLKSLPKKIGYPSKKKAETSFKLQNINRQKEKNLYQLYTLSYQGKGEEKTSPLGFVQLGRMPTLGYKEGTEENPTAHHEILKKWMELGITKQIKEEDFQKENFERIENRGLAVILPLFNYGILKEEKISSIEACYKLVCKMTNLAKKSGEEKDLLPIEKTLPYQVIGLFDSEDGNIDHFQKNDFSVDKNKGFGWFYPKDEKPQIPQPATMVTRLVE